MFNLEKTFLKKEINTRFKAMVFCFVASLICLAMLFFWMLYGLGFQVSILQKSDNYVSSYFGKYQAPDAPEKTVGWFSIEEMPDGSVKRTVVDETNRTVSTITIPPTQIRFFETSPDYKLDLKIPDSNLFTKAIFDEKGAMVKSESETPKILAIDSDGFISLRLPTQKLSNQILYEMTGGLEGQSMFKSKAEFESFNTKIYIAMAILFVAVALQFVVAVFLLMLLYSICRAVPMRFRTQTPAAFISILILGILLCKIGMPFNSLVGIISTFILLFGIWLVVKMALSLFDMLSNAALQIRGHAMPISAFAAMIIFLSFYAFTKIAFENGKQVPLLISAIGVIALYTLLKHMKNCAIEILDAK